MVGKGGFGSLFDLASLVVDLITLGKVKGKDGEKQVVSPEQMEALKKTLVPKIFGAGPADEALFNAALAKLVDRRNIEIQRFLDRQTPYDQKRFRFAIAIIPDEPDRIQVLNMYSELTDEEMMQVAKATGMISGGPGPIAKLSKKAQKAIRFIRRKLWPQIAKFLKGLDRGAGKIASEINRKNVEFERRRKKHYLINFWKIKISRFNLYK